MQNLILYTHIDFFNGWGYQPFILDLFFLLAIFSAIMVIISNNPIVSVLFLIALFVNIAGYLILIGVNFVGLSYLLVYVGAISMLFLFILMLINIRISELQSYTSNSLPLGYFVAIAVLYSLWRCLPFKNTGDILSVFNTNFSIVEQDYLSHVSHYSWEASLAPSADICSIGSVMYSSHGIWLILTGLILLLAMVGVIAITVAPADRN